MGFNCTLVNSTETLWCSQGCCVGSDEDQYCCPYNYDVEPDPIYAILGIMGGVVGAFIILVIAICLLWMMIKKKKKNQNGQPGQVIEPGGSVLVPPVHYSAPVYSTGVRPTQTSVEAGDYCTTQSSSYEWCYSGCCGYTPYQYCCDDYGSMSTGTVVGIIVGGVLGGILLLVLSIALICYCLKKTSQPGRVIVPVVRTPYYPALSYTNSSVSYPMYPAVPRPMSTVPRPMSTVPQTQPVPYPLVPHM